LYAVLLLSVATLSCGFAFVHHGMWATRNRAQIAADAAVLAAAVALAEQPADERRALQEAKWYAQMNGCGSLDCRLTVARIRQRQCEDLKLRVELRSGDAKRPSGGPALAGANALVEHGVLGFRPMHDVPAPVAPLALLADDPNVAEAWGSGKPARIVVGSGAGANAFQWLADSADTPTESARRGIRKQDLETLGEELVVGSVLTADPKQASPKAMSVLQEGKLAKAFPVASSIDGVLTVVGFLPGAVASVEISEHGASFFLTPTPMTVAAKIAVRGVDADEHGCRQIATIRLVP
jgi:hypothetical protein